jgi:hypothetical protein
MEWIKDGAEKTMGEVADEWLRRNFKAARWAPAAAGINALDNL